MSSKKKSSKTKTEVNNSLREIKKNWKFLSIILIILVAMAIVGEKGFYDRNKPEEVLYSQFLSDIDSGKIDTIYYNSSDELMRYTLYTDESRLLTKTELVDYTYSKDNWRTTTYPAGENFRESMLSKGVHLVVKSFEPIGLSVISGILAALLPLLLMFVLLKAIMGGTSKINDTDIIKETNVKFSDVIGHDEVIKDLQFIVKLMKNPKTGKKLGASIPKGMLFSGLPGTGKTLLAKAVAGESGIPFLYMNASSFIELYVGTGAKRVRSLFALAKKMSPCIVFIDEIDAVGKTRNSAGSNSEDAKTITALLTELDGFDTQSGVFVIGATNNAELLDKALIRSGRFDRQIEVLPPKDWKVRKELFTHYLNGVDITDDFDIDNISKQTTGFTGSDISSITNEAKLIAMMRSSETVSTNDVEEAIDKRIFKGNRSNKDRYTKDNQIVAYHESGHAVMSYLLHESISRASIIGMTSGVGGAVIKSEKLSQFYTKEELESQIMICYAGRCSEELKFSDVTTGASSDITQATEIIKSYILKYGFEKEFGMLDIDCLRGSSLVGSKEILTLMSEMAKRIESKTFSLLEKNYHLIDTLADKLLTLETISGDGIVELLDNCVKED